MDPFDDDPILEDLYIGLSSGQFPKTMELMLNDGFEGKQSMSLTRIAKQACSSE